MTLVWHMAWSDLRRLRLPLALWAGLIAAKLGLGAWLLWGGVTDPRRFEVIALAGNWLIGVEVLMGYVLVAALVQGDSAVGTMAFWMTRPVSGGRLLAAKVLGLGIIFGTVPLAVTTPWWLACGYGTREVTLAAGETLFWHAAVVVVALPLATLTDEFSRFLVWSLVVVVAIAIVNLMIVVGTGTGLQMAADADVASARGVLGTLIFLIGGCVAAVQQFYWRRIARSFAIIGAAIVMALVVLISSGVVLALRPAIVKMVRVARGESAPVKYRDDAASTIQLAFRGAWSREVPGQDSTLSVGFKAEGGPEGSFLTDGYAEQQWSWPDGVVLKRKGDLSRVQTSRAAWWHALEIGAPKLDPAFMKFLEQLERGGGGLAGGSTSQAGEGMVVAKMPPAFAARTMRDPPSYLLRAQFRLIRPVAVDERPVQIGQTLEGGASRIFDVQDRYVTRQGVSTRTRRFKPPVDPATHVAPESVHYRDIVLVEHGPALRWDVGWFSGLGTFLIQRLPDSAYFLINRARGNADIDSYYNATGPVRFGTVGIRWRLLNFRAPREFREGKWVEQAGWFEDQLTLAKVVGRDEAWVTKELRVERFAVDKPGTIGGAR